MNKKTTSPIQAPPAYQEYPARMLIKREFRQLTLEQKGLLYQLRMECWENGNVPSDASELARIVGCSPDEIGNALPGLIGVFFTENRGFLTCPNLEDYREKLDHQRSRMSSGGKRGVMNREAAKRAQIEALGVDATHDATHDATLKPGLSPLVKSSTVKSSTEKQSQKPYRSGASVIPPDEAYRLAQDGE